MAYETAGPLSADRLNPLVDELEAWGRETYEKLIRAFYESGHPVGTVERPAAEQYATLIQLRDTGSPEYWQDPQAQRDLDELAKRFGPVRPVAVPAYAPPPPAPPQPQLRLAAVPPVSAPAAGPGPGVPAPYPQSVTGG